MPYSQEDQKWIQNQLQAELIGRQIITHDSVNSTNDVAKNLVGEPEKEGPLFWPTARLRAKDAKGEPGIPKRMSAFIFPSI